MTQPADGPPPFDAAFDGEDAERRVYGTILRTRTPTTATTVADDAACDPKTARKYLDWFVDLGVATRHEGRPTTYERNDDYFAWRRVDELATDHSVAELRERVVALSDRIETFRERYEADAPSEVDAVRASETVASPDDADPLATVYDDLTAWRTAVEERDLYERARRQASRSHGEATGD
ncbi:sugar-specific transcriptional regulator TrmB [Halobaculum sp. MBLA0147]|uniref:DUF7342 family protein n=1 Tax=Halobaculum sp. MBLA0147 TaxID=3079934 RepID=UPI00352643FB